MDGVLCSFIKGACKLLEEDDPYDKEENFGLWDFFKPLGYSQKEIEAAWSMMGFKFWAELEKTLEADELVQACINKVGCDNICFLSSPCNTIGCMDGKRFWTKEHYPHIKNRLFGNAKQFCASYDHLLIDDYDKNVKEFTEAGGKAILVPRPWNSLYQLKDQCLDYVLRELNNA